MTSKAHSGLSCTTDLSHLPRHLRYLIENCQLPGCSDCTKRDTCPLRKQLSALLDCEYVKRTLSCSSNDCTLYDLLKSNPLELCPLLSLGDSTARNS